MATPARELLTRQFSYPAGDDQVAPRMETWTDPALSGGGYGQAQLSHALGLSLWLTGCRASEVFAFGWSPAGAAVEFHDAIAVRFDNGAVGTVAGASNHTGTHGGRHQLEVRILGSRGQVDLDIGRDTVRAWDAGRPIEVGVIAAGAGDYECSGPVDVLVRAGLGQPVVNASPAELGARTTELIDAAYRSMRSGSMERVEAPGFDGRCPWRLTSRARACWWANSCWRPTASRRAAPSWSTSSLPGCTSVTPCGASFSRRAASWRRPGTS